VKFRASIGFHAIAFVLSAMICLVIGELVRISYRMTVRSLLSGCTCAATCEDGCFGLVEFD
jgi:hypothetical protein